MSEVKASADAGGDADGLEEAAMLDLDPALTLKPDTAFFILLKAREFDAKTEAVDEDEGSNPSDDRGVDVLEFGHEEEDATEEELASAVSALNEDEQLDLIALIWIGRGDFGFDEWADAREGAREVDPKERPTYVMEMPRVSDYLEEALSGLGLSIEDYLDSGVHGPAADQLPGMSGLPGTPSALDTD